MWENVIDPDRPQTTKQRMRIACWITKTTETPTYALWQRVLTFH